MTMRSFKSTYLPVTFLLGAISAPAFAVEGGIRTWDGEYVTNFQGECWQERSSSENLMNCPVNDPGTALTETNSAFPDSRTSKDDASQAASDSSTGDLTIVKEFGVNEADLDSADAQEIADAAKRATVESRGQKIVVSGYADHTGTVAHNRELARQRAENAKAAIVEAGVPAASIEVRNAGVSSSKAAACAGMSGSGLAECLQDDRKVEVSIPVMAR